MLRFIDENGDDHTSNGVKATVADRDYFKADESAKKVPQVKF